MFVRLIEDYEKGISNRIEVGDVQNLGVFKQTIELMFEDHIALLLTKIGVYRSIDILEVSSFVELVNQKSRDQNDNIHIIWRLKYQFTLIIGYKHL